MEKLSAKSTTRLLEALDAHFNNDELRSLCVDLNIDYDNLAGETKRGKIRELVSYVQRTERIADLIEACSIQRPNVKWRILIEVTYDSTREPDTQSEKPVARGQNVSTRVAAFGAVATVIVAITCGVFALLQRQLSVTPMPRPTNTPLPQVGPNFDYFVRVQEQGIGKPIPDAKVTIDLGGGTASKDEYTDSNGLARMFIDFSYAGKAGRLIIEATGYELYIQNIDLSKDALPDIVRLKPLLTSAVVATQTSIPLTDTPTPKQTDTPVPKSTPTRMSTPSLTATSQSTKAPSGDNVWHGQYFANTEFRAPPAYERDDASIAFDWGAANPAPNVPLDNFSIRWIRCLDFEERYYTFSAKADDSFKVYVDDTKIIDIRGGSGEQKFYVSAGRHCLKLDFIEYQGAASVYFDFKAGEQPTPAADINTWLGEFFANTEFRSPSVYSRKDAFISFHWGNSNPAPNVPLDNFSIRWTRCLDFEERYYTFNAEADDGLRVYVDDTKVLDIRNGWGEQKFYVSAGRHCLKLEFIEYQGDASVYFDFQASEQPTPVSSTDTWLGEFFANTDLRSPAVYTRNEAFISFDWGYANPAPNVPLDNFSIRWTRCLDFEERYYTFSANADDSLTVYLDNTKVMDIRGGSGEQKLLVSAGRHCLKLEFIENQGMASVYFEFK
jgi:hypothetical protein